MQLHFSPSMRSITISSNNGFVDLMKIKIAARHISYRTLFHTILILGFLLPFVFILTALVTLEGVNKCSSFDCLGRRFGPKLLGRDDSVRLVRDFHKILNQVKTEELPAGIKLPDSFNQLVSSLKHGHYDAKTFAIILKSMMEKYELEIREAKFAELMNKHFAASSIPKGIHCLSLRLTDEYSSNAHARKQLPAPELLPLLSDNSYYHFVLPTDNILAASVVLFPSLDKVVFLDDDVVIQRDLTPLWDIDLEGKVNGAVETCRGEDDWVMSKRFRNYFNFSHPFVAHNLNPDECAWAYGMNIFDLHAWRNTNIRDTYHSWLKENLKSNLSLWKLGTLPPALVAFKGHVHPIDPSWHMLGLGYQNRTKIENVKKAAVIHYNGQSKPWLPIGFEHLRPFWSKYVNYSNDFLRHCHILES